MLSVELDELLGKLVRLQGGRQPLFLPSGCSFPKVRA